MRPELIRACVHIQAALGDNLTLHSVAARAGISSFHFEREFCEVVGEPVARYIRRLRLERAALRLLLHDDTVLDIALACGFNTHETFSRAFRRHFSVSPREFRKLGRLPLGSTNFERAATAGEAEVSKTQVCRLRPVPVAFIRHTGPYEQVSDTAWHRLTAWAGAKGLGPPFTFFGIAHDAPGITPPNKLRFDAAIAVPAGTTPADGIGVDALPSGPFGVTSFVGPFSQLPQAYTRVMGQCAALKRYEVLGLPCVELYHTVKVSADAPVNHTEICVPLRERRAH